MKSDHQHRRVAGRPMVPRYRFSSLRALLPCWVWQPCAVPCIHPQPQLHLQVYAWHGMVHAELQLFRQGYSCKICLVPCLRLDNVFADASTFDDFNVYLEEYSDRLESSARLPLATAVLGIANNTCTSCMAPL